MKLGQLSALGWLCVLGSACTEFPSIPDTGCGNHVIEGSEDCDGFSRPGSPGTVCRKPGTAFECHLDCSVDDQGRQHSCPSGWGCDNDAVCRAPSGTFSEFSSSANVGAWSLNTGDFDGDGRQDVVSSEPLDEMGATRLRFNYFDERGALSDTRLFPKTVLSPTFNTISDGDSISDVAFTVGQLGLMAGRPDRSWLPEVFSSYRQENSSVRIVGIYDRPVDWSASFTTLISFPDVTGFFLGDRDSGALVNHLTIPGTIADLAGDLVSGNVFEDPKHSPCDEPVFAMRDSTRFNVVNVCETNEQGITWRDRFELTEIQLAPPARIDVAPQLLDMNGDGHLDVLVGADGVPYVAYGDGQTLSVATPYDYPVADSIFPSGTPLAAADFSGDGALDFVFPDRLVVSSTAYTGALPTYHDIPNVHTAPWTIAKIADFNGNGKLDVVTASSGSLNLDFYNGTGSEYLSASLITTSAPVQFLAAGDVDGDSLTDLALFEVPLPNQKVSTLKVAFGSAFAPLATPIAVGQIAGVEALGSYRDAGRDNLTVCASENIAGRTFGALTLLAGGPDRVPFAPMTLTEFSSNNSVQDASAFAVVSGHFLDPKKMDLLALAFFRGNGGQQPINVWAVPAIADPGSSPRRLPGELDPRLTPVVFMPDGSISADVASTSANLDDDEREEAIFVMPADGGSHCGLLLIGADSRGSLGSAGRNPVVIDEPCPDPQIAAVRFNRDDKPALALLTGRTGADDRHLYVLWNDGSGHFAAGNKVLVSGEESPQAFTVWPGGAENVGFAYLTKNALRIVRTPTAGAFAAAEDMSPAVSVNNGTGIVSADVNGDHLTDLVFSESGKLRVLRAELELP